MMVECFTCKGYGEVDKKPIERITTKVGWNAYVNFAQVECKTCNGEKWIDVDLKTFGSLLFLDRIEDLIKKRIG